MDKHILHKVFTLDLAYSDAQPLQYTLKFRKAENAPWLWSGKRIGQDDGLIVFRENLLLDASIKFNQIFENTDQSINLKSVSSQVRGVSLWKVSSQTIPGISSVNLGFPNQLNQFMILVQLASAWMGPSQGKGNFSNDRDGFLLEFLRTDGLHVAVLPLAGLGNHCTTHILSDNSGNVVLKTRNDNAHTAKMHCIVGISTDQQMAVDAVMYKAREMVYKANKHEPPQDIIPSWMETWVDGLAYCTWNGIGRELTEEKLISAMKDLNDTGLKSMKISSNCFGYYILISHQLLP